MRRRRYQTTVEGRLSMKDYRIQNKVRTNPPLSYTTNNDHEKNCIELVTIFMQRLHMVQQQQQETSKIAIPSQHLILTKNEFHVQKCVCSTIKPQQLPYPNMDDVYKCSEFVANFFNYEPLKDPFKPPSFLPSPTQIIEPNKYGSIPPINNPTTT